MDRRLVVTDEEIHSECESQAKQREVEASASSPEAIPHRIERWRVIPFLNDGFGIRPPAAKQAGFRAN